MSAEELSPPALGVVAWRQAGAEIKKKSRLQSMWANNHICNNTNHDNNENNDDNNNTILPIVLVLIMIIYNVNIPTPFSHLSNNPFQSIAVVIIPALFGFCGILGLRNPRFFGVGGGNFTPNKIK